MTQSRIFLTKTQAHFINEKCFNLKNTLDSITFYHEVEKAAETWVWVVVVAFPLRPPCCITSLIEHRPSPYVWEWCRKKWLLSRMALLCLGLRPSRSVIPRLLPGALWRAAVARSRAVHWAGFSETAVLQLAPHPPTPLGSVPSGFDLHCSVPFRLQTHVKSGKNPAEVQVSAMSTPVSTTDFMCCLQKSWGYWDISAFGIASVLQTDRKLLN